MKTLNDIGIFSKNSTYIIAEIGINHGGNINIAKELIDSAAKTGANAVKFQTYITEKRAKADSPIFDILKKCELPLEAFEELKNYAEAQNITFFSTPFDETSVEYLEQIGCPLYKIASFDIGNIPLLKKISQTHKPLILSVGMSSIDEIEAAINLITKYHSNVAILHCITAYPTKEEDANLGAVSALKNHFSDFVIGQSDHTDDILVPLYAVAAGAQILEKHYKVDEDMDCVDSPVSITEKQMTKLVTETRRLEKILGKENIGVTEPQKKFLWLKRKVN